MKLIFDRSVPGRRAIRNVASDVDTAAYIKPELLREQPPELPELSSEGQAGEVSGDGQVIRLLGDQISDQRLEDLLVVSASTM